MLISLVKRDIVKFKYIQYDREILFVPAVCQGGVMFNAPMYARVNYKSKVIPKVPRYEAPIFSL